MIIYFYSTNTLIFISFILTPFIFSAVKPVAIIAISALAPSLNFSFAIFYSYI